MLSEEPKRSPRKVNIIVTKCSNIFDKIYVEKENKKRKGTKRNSKRI